MSTLLGHSDLQALHEIQRSITWWSLSLVRPSLPSCPDIASLNAFARPRVECSSSRVALKLGHMVPPSCFRHSPTPVHMCTDSRKLFSLLYRNSVLTGSSAYWVPYRRF